MGSFIPIAILILRSTSIIIPALPGTAYSILAGTLLGFNKGYLVICIADIISCNISFFLSRKYGGNIIRRITSERMANKIEKLSKKHLEDNFILMTGLLMTGIFDFISYTIGLTKVKWNKYFLALVISVIVSNIPIVGLGAGLVSNGKLILVLSIIGVIALSFINKKINPYTSNK
tara:strand:+ start:2076 stop:2600 length:525 start_codon:yes stop_codon:yes gene_type:complete